MAEENESQDARQFSIQKIYVKDVSFETPNTPEVFTQDWEPEMEFDLGSTTQRIREDVYDVTLKVTLTVKLGDKTAYLIEVGQAGIFAAKGFPENELAHLVRSYCPSILFPFARQVVADLVSQGGFPPMILAPVNFDALYAQEVERLKNAEPVSTMSH